MKDISSSVSPAHTPTPLVEARFKTTTWADGMPGFTVEINIGGHPLGWITLLDTRDQGLACFLVRAVNAHEDLVAALKAALRCGFHGAPSKDIDTTVHMIHAAIAKAEGK